MAQDELFKKLCKPETIRIGWHLAQNDSRDDFVTDPIGHADFASNFPDRLTYLIEEVQSYRYRSRYLLDIDIPKTGLSVRPGNVLPIEEATLLHTIVYLLAPLLDNNLSPSVYSYRLHQNWAKKAKKGESLFKEGDIEIPFLKKNTIRSINPFESWYECWPQFGKDAFNAYTTEGFTHLTKTDIAAYFENIDLQILESQIRSLLKRQEENILQLLFRILEAWTRVTSTGTPIGRGIPQGCEISSFLGNLYLLPLDRALTRFCQKNHGKWFRYVDDVMVFTKSETNARKAVFEINEALHKLHLNLQGSKTKIISGDALGAELDHSQFDKINVILETLRKLDLSKRSASPKITAELKPLSSAASRFTKKLPEGVKNLDGKENRLFRRLLTTYGFAKRNRLQKAAITALTELPDLRILKKSLSYLSNLEYPTHVSSFRSIMKLVEEDRFPFPYQVAMIFEALTNFHPTDTRQVIPKLRKHLRIERDWVVVQKALEAIMTYPYDSKRIKTLVEKYIKHNHPMVRRAACMLLTRAPKGYLKTCLGRAC
jgi:reverse transcriptase-like protein